MRLEAYRGRDGRERSVSRVRIRRILATGVLCLAALQASAGAAYDAVVLLYGLCGKATDGVRARAVPVVLPRVHDCIAMFLGSRVRYQEEFSRCPGTYWYVADYIERGRGSDAASAIGGSSDDGIRKMQREFVDTYGAENAAYLMEVLGGWSRHYSRAVFIDMGIGGSGEAERVARAEAERRGWTFERRSGDAGLVCRLLAGDWGDDFLVLQPGQRVAESYDDGAIRASDG